MILLRWGLLTSVFLVSPCLWAPNTRMGRSSSGAGGCCSWLCCRAAGIARFILWNEGSWGRCQHGCCGGGGGASLGPRGTGYLPTGTEEQQHFSQLRRLSQCVCVHRLFPSSFLCQKRKFLSLSLSVCPKPLASSVPHLLSRLDPSFLLWVHMCSRLHQTLEKLKKTATETTTLSLAQLPFFSGLMPYISPFLHHQILKKDNMPYFRYWV